MRGFALLNTSSDANVSKEILAQMAHALGRQIAEDAAPAWQRTPLDVALVNALADVPEGYVPSTVQDTLDDPNALAYHSVDSNGRPYVLIGWGVIRANGGQLISGADSLSSSIGHEWLETFGDPYCEDWWDLPDGSGEIPRELCDSVQGWVYTKEGVAVPDFLWPRYFSREDGQLCQTGQLKEHGGLGAGGYYTKRVGGPHGTVTNQFGATVEAGGMPEWKRIAKACMGSRGSIRKGMHPAWVAA